MTQASTRRLLSDLREIHQESSEACSVLAYPIENNLYEWHGNIVAPPESAYAGAIFHVILKFNADYPISPPKVSMCTNITHSHVYGDWICLDMLETHRSFDAHSGWSSAYSTAAILLQLQAFLLEEEDSCELQTIEDEVLATRQFSCTKCGHNMQKNQPYPWHPSWPKPLELTPFTNELKIHLENVKSKRRSGRQFAIRPTILIKRPTSLPALHSNKESEQSTFIMGHYELSQDMLLHIMSYLTVQDWNRCQNVNKLFKSVCLSHHLRDRREMICFHSKVSFEQDTLGIGLNIEMDRSGNKIIGANTPLDILSYSAFHDQGIRCGAWKEPFRYFLPLYINPQHAKSAMPILEQSINHIYGIREFDPLCALDLLCKLMKKMVVDVMSDHMHASIRALEGYCYFHRLMIHLVLTYPMLQQHVEDGIEAFLLDENCRIKSALPDIGDFMSLLSLSHKYQWKDVAEPVISEILDRNQLWIMKKYPELAETHSSHAYGKRSRDDYREDSRVEQSFKVSQVSIKLQMFHVYFLTRVATSLKDDIHDPTISSLERIARSYDLRYGKPTHAMQELLQREVFKIQKTDSYQQYFTYTLDQDVSDRKVEERLVTAMKNSEKKAYHKAPAHRPSYRYDDRSYTRYDDRSYNRYNNRDNYQYRNHKYY
jgi:ubiquitin-protein ligase